MTAGYARLPQPAWPDPHPGGAEARDEEYSRLTEPERYAIVHTRARLWASVLADRLGAVAEPLSAPSAAGTPSAGDDFAGGVRLISPRPGTLPLLLLERDGTPAVLRIAVVRPEIELITLPDCGCDACDRGSDDLLEAIDETIGTVVTGPFVVLRGQGQQESAQQEQDPQGRGWYGHWYPDGGSARDADLGWVMEVGERLASGEDVHLPPGTEAHVGKPWL